METTAITVPQDQTMEVYEVLRHFCDAILESSGTYGETTSFKVSNLRVSELVLALLEARKEITFVTAMERDEAALRAMDEEL